MYTHASNRETIPLNVIGYIFEKANVDLRLFDTKKPLYHVIIDIIVLVRIDTMLQQ